MQIGSVWLDIIRRRLQARAKEIGRTLRDASLQAGLGKGYATDIVSGKSKAPELQKLAALAEALDCDLEYLIGGQDLPRASAAPPVNLTTEPPEGQRLIPLYRQTAKGMPGASAPIDHIAAPPALTRVPGAYALAVTDASMAPRYEVGEIVFVHPGLPPRPGDYVAMRFVGGGIVPRRLISGPNGQTVTARLNSPIEESTPAQEVEACHRIVGAATI